MKKNFTLLFTILLSNISFCQQTTVDAFLDDATWYTNKFITPATDATVYMCSGNWMTSAKKRKLFSVNFSASANVFLVPKTDRNFTINNNDFKFFTIKDNAGNTVNGDVATPTAFGDDTQYNMVGNIQSFFLNLPITIKSPKGINKETVPYPYLQASVALWGGFELSGKYSKKIKLDQMEYQIYGVGVKHNFSQYIKKLEAQKFYLSAMVVFSKERVSSNFLDITTAYGTLGLNQITGKVDTWQFQFSASKEWKNFELIASSINNYSSFEYVLTGDRGSLEDVIPVQETLNNKLKEIYTKKLNAFYEISGRYRVYDQFHLQASATFGKFLNTSLSIQYDFNSKEKTK